MKFKSVAALLAAASLCLALCACGKEKAPAFVPEADTVQAFSEEQKQDYTDDSEKADTVNGLLASFEGVEETSPDAFETEDFENGLRITAYLGKDTVIRVPEAINGRPVVALGNSVFADQTHLNKLYLPDSIRSVGKNLLKNCKELSALRTPTFGEDKEGNSYLGYLFGADSYEGNSLHIPASLHYLEIGAPMTALADRALLNCNYLLAVTLPDTMTELGEYALFQCTSLLAVNTRSLQKLGNHALDSCSSLTVLEFGEGAVSFGLGALEGCTSLRRLTLPFVGGSAEENTYLAYLFGAASPEFAQGFYPSYLWEITLLSTCRSLAENAFLHCKGLTAVNLPDSLTSIGARAFGGCVRLTSAAIPDGVTAIGENAFFGCISLKELILAEDSKLTSMGINAFYGCDGLEKIVLPTSLKTLPASAFADCLSLREISLGGVETVGKNAFRNCIALQKADARGFVEIGEGNEALTAVLYPNEK